MRTRVLLAVATFAVVGMVAGCARTTTGTVAMTTQPGSSTDTSSGSPSAPSFPRTTSPGTTAPAPPPGDALDVTCAEYVQLDPAGQMAVIEEILENESSVLPPEETEVAKTLADAVCTFLPNSPVSEILLGETPP